MFTYSWKTQTFRRKTLLKVIRKAACVCKISCGEDGFHEEPRQTCVLLEEASAEKAAAEKVAAKRL